MACIHLRSSFPKEIFVVPADGEWAIVAWCSVCEEARLSDQGWYDKADAVAQWDWSCDHCLDEAIARADHTTFSAGPAEETPDAPSAA